MHRSFIGVILAASLLAACGSPSVETTLLMPAKQSGMVNAKKIGIAPLKGDSNGVFTGQLRSYIANIRVENEPYFTLVDLDRNTVLGEQRLSDSALSNQSSGVALGNLTTADTVLAGSVEHDYENKPTKHLVQKGNAMTTVTCFDQSAATTLNLRATNVETGIISFIKTYQDGANDKWCNGSLVPYTQNESESGALALLNLVTSVASIATKKKTRHELTAEIQTGIFSEIREDIAPYPVTFTIQFLKNDNGGLGGSRAFKDNQEVNEAFTIGLKFANAEQYERACEEFNKAASKFSKSPAIYNNVGVCAEMKGDLEQALAFYERANRETKAPVKVISKALSRVRANIRSRSATIEQVSSR